MKKKTSAASPAGVIAVSVARMGSEVVPVALAPESTVRQALEAAGVSTTGAVEYFVSGVRADLDDVLEDKDVLSLVSPKQAGS